MSNPQGFNLPIQSGLTPGTGFPTVNSQGITTALRLLLAADIPSLLSTKISDFSTAADARIAAALGVSVQAYDADLVAIAALSPSDGAFLRRTGGAWVGAALNSADIPDAAILAPGSSSRNTIAPSGAFEALTLQSFSALGNTLFKLLDNGSNLLFQITDRGAITDQRNTASATGNSFVFQKNRAGSILSNGDELFTIKGSAYDGTSYQNSSMIYSVIDGVTSVSSLPTRLSFWTTQSGSLTYTERLRIDNAGLVSIGTVTGGAGRLNVQGNSDIVQAVVRGTSGQTANLQEWQSSTPTTLASINPSGYITAPRIGIGATPSVELHIYSAAQPEIRLRGNRPFISWYDTSDVLAGSIGSQTDPGGTTRGLQYNSADTTGVTASADNFLVGRWNGGNNKLYFGDNGAASLIQGGHKLHFNVGVAGVPSAFLGPQLAIVGSTTSIAQIGINQGNPTAALDVVGLNALSSSYGLKIKSTSTELITTTADRDFSGAGNWTGTNWAIASAAFQHTAGSTADAVLANANMTASQIVSGDIYRVIFTITGRTAGTVTAKLGTAVGTAASIPATYTQYILATANDSNLIFTPSTDFDGSIDNISVARLANKFTVDNAGNAMVATALGVGVTPSSIVQAMEIRGAGASSSANVAAIFGGNNVPTNGTGHLALYTTDSQDVDLGAMLVLGGQDGGSATRSFGAIAGRKENNTSSNRLGYLQLLYRASSNLTEGARITSTGLFGIGTGSTVSARLHVNAAASGVGLIVQGNATTPGNLQEWKSSTPTTLASMDSVGRLSIADVLAFNLGASNQWHFFASSVGLSVVQTGVATRLLVAPGGITTVSVGDAVAAAVTNALVVDHGLTSGGGSANIGTGILLRANSSTAATLREAARMRGVLTTATDASYVGSLILSAWKMVTGTPTEFDTLTINTTGVVLLAGTLSNTAFRFVGDGVDAGFYRRGLADWSWAYGGTDYFRLDIANTAVELGSSIAMTWGATTAVGVKDTGLARNAAGQVRVTDGGAGSGNLLATSVRMNGDPGSGAASTTTLTNGTGTPSNTATPAGYVKIYVGTVASYVPYYQ